MANGPSAYDYMDPRYGSRPRISTPAFNPNAGSALDYPDNPLGPARPVPSAIPPPAPPPSLGLPPGDLPQQPPPDPYGEAVERRRTLREAPPTAVPGQPPWWKQILGYAAESFRPTAGMGIGDRLFGVAGAKREAAGKAQELERSEKDIEIAKGLATHRRGLSQDAEKARQFGIEQESQDRRAGWVVKQPDDPESKFHHVAAPSANGVVMGLLKKESTEPMMTVTADIARAMGIPVEDGQLKEMVSVKSYSDYMDFARTQTLSPGETAFRPSLTGPSEQVASVPKGREFIKAGSGVFEDVSGAPGSQLTEVARGPTSASDELSPTSIASNKRQIERDYNTDIQRARNEYIANTLGSELKPAAPGTLWGTNENEQAGIDTAERLWREAIEAANKRYVEGYRDVLGEIAPTREDPDLPSVYSESGLEAPPAELPNPSEDPLRLDE